MQKEIIIKDRVRKLPTSQVDDAIREAKTGTSNKTVFGVRIKRLRDLLILL